MATPKFRFELEIDAVTTEVTPINEIKLTKEPADDDLFRYYLRPKLSNVILKGSDYNLIATKRDSGSPCGDIILTVTSYCGDTDNWAEEFIFSIHDCEFNDDKCTVTVKTDPNDNYLCISRNWDADINLFDFCERFTSKFRILLLTSRQMLWPVPGGGGNAFGPTGAYEYSIDLQLSPYSNLDVTDPDGGWNTSRRLVLTTSVGTLYLWIRFISVLECVDGTLPTAYTETQEVPFQYEYTAVGCYNVISDDCDTTGTITIAWEIPYIVLTGGPISSSFPTAAGLGITSGDITETADEVPPNSGDWYLGMFEIVTLDYFYWFTPSIDSDYTIDTTIYNGIKLSDVLDYQVGEVCDNLSGVKSDFFQLNEDNTSDDNYVTETYNYWKADQILLHQITDVARPNSNTSEQATRMEYKFRTILESIANIFQVFPSFDGDYLKLEHESLYQESVTFDLSSKTYRNNYTYDLSGVWARMDYSFYASFSIDFKGLPMEYGPACTNRKQTDIDVQYIATDFNNIYNNEAYEEDERGIVMTHHIFDGSNNWAIVGQGAISGIFFPNIMLGWASLHQNFHRHNRPLISGTMNGSSVTHESAVRIKEQTINMGLCCDEELTSGLVTTELGDGLIEKAELNLRTGQVDFTLKHEQ